MGKIQEKGGGRVARKTDPIGVFDSGVGGISVLRELVKLMPEENYLYYGDSANAPYGDRPTEQVRELTLRVARDLVQRGVKALVVACNTATSAAVSLLRQTWPELIVIGIEPALKPAVEQFPTGRIGIMATQVTLREGKLAHQLERFPQAAVSLIPAPGLVELIEQGHTQGREVESLLERVLSPYKGKLDALVLGCTHYPFVKEAISHILGPETLLFDGGEGTARQTRRCLAAAELLSPGPGSVQIENSLGESGILQLSMELLGR